MKMTQNKYTEIALTLFASLCREKKTCHTLMKTPQMKLFFLLVINTVESKGNKYSKVLSNILIITINCSSIV